MARNYVTLRQVLDDYKITMDGDDFVSTASDAALRNIAMRGIREIGFDAGKKVRSLKLPVTTSNDTVALPDDFVDLIKVGGVGSDGLVYVFGHNKNINYSQKEVTAATTTDAKSNPLYRDVDAKNQPVDREDSKSKTSGVADEANPTNGFDSYLFRNYLYGSNLRTLYGVGGGHMIGEYRLNLDQNRIELKVNSSVDEVVIEYVADEARSTDPMVHVYCEEALRCYIYYKLCERKTSVHAGEKARARTEYYNELRKAKARLNNFTKEEALKTIRKNFKQAPKY
tara:strand:- start:2366 stop:3214 length:849 start_codon:yes stop_codon:yes gene_type:complete